MAALWDACAIAEEWLLDPTLAVRVAHMLTCFEQKSGHSVRIISGYRSPEKQRELEERGRPAAPVHLSNHTICPARAVDVMPSGYASRQLKLLLGECGVMSGLRWGGGSPVENGIPSDWNHFDLGPRPQ